MPQLRGFVFLTGLLGAFFCTPIRADNIHGIQAGGLSLDFGKAHGATLPLQDFLDHLIVLITVNGHPGLRFAIDTGSANSVIDSKTAVTIGVPTSDRYQPAGGVGSNLLLLPLGKPVDAAMGGITLAGLRFAEMDTSSWDGRLGLHLDGIIGSDVLQNCVVHIDYIRQSLELIDPATFQPPGRDTTVLPLAFSSVPCIDAEIGNGQDVSIPVNLMVDTGGADALSLPYHFLQDHPDLRIDQGGSSTIVRGVAGIIDESIHQLGDLNLGGIVIAHPSAVIPNHIKGGPGLATMGEEILRRFDVTIDLPGRNLYLKPNANFGDPFLYVDSGLVVRATGPGLRTFIVHAVTPGTASARAGFKAGDVLMVIGDTALTDLSLNGVRGLLHDLQPLEITVNRGGKLVTLDFVRDNGPESK